MEEDGFLHKSLDDISLDEMTEAAKASQNIDIPNSGFRNIDFEVLRDYGPLSSSKYPLYFKIIDWNGHVRYDVRHWFANAKPGKGITLSGKERLVILSNVCKFENNEVRSDIFAQYQIKDTTVKIYDNLITLSSVHSKDFIWNKEINIVDWGGFGQKIDIRSWTSDYSSCTKGIRMSFDEMRYLIDILKNVGEI